MTETGEVIPSDGRKTTLLSAYGGAHDSAPMLLHVIPRARSVLSEAKELSGPYYVILEAA